LRPVKEVLRVNRNLDDILAGRHQDFVHLSGAYGPYIVNRAGPVRAIENTLAYGQCCRRAADIPDSSNSRTETGNDGCRGIDVDRYRVFALIVSVVFAPNQLPPPMKLVRLERARR
jgi:hypothetical protein